MANKYKKSPQQRAKLRTCASCEWIYEGEGQCPKCEFVSYGARFVYGDKAYTYKRTQEPWMNRKISKYTVGLLREINEYNNSPEKLENVYFKKLESALIKGVYDEDGY